MTPPAEPEGEHDVRERPAERCEPSNDNVIEESADSSAQRPHQRAAAVAGHAVTTVVQEGGDVEPSPGQADEEYRQNSDVDERVASDRAVAGHAVTPVVEENAEVESSPGKEDEEYRGEHQNSDVDEHVASDRAANESNEPTTVELKIGTNKSFPEVENIDILVHETKPLSSPFVYGGAACCREVRPRLVPRRCCVKESSQDDCIIKHLSRRGSSGHWARVKNPF